jgi:hypothetical protein
MITIACCWQAIWETKEKYIVMYHQTIMEKNVQHLCIAQHEKRLIYQIKNCFSICWQLQGWHRPLINLATVNKNMCDAIIYKVHPCYHINSMAISWAPHQDRWCAINCNHNVIIPLHKLCFCLIRQWEQQDVYIIMVYSPDYRL